MLEDHTTPECCTVEQNKIPVKIYTSTTPPSFIYTHLSCAGSRIPLGERWGKEYRSSFYYRADAHRKPPTLTVTHYDNLKSPIPWHACLLTVLCHPILFIYLLDRPSAHANLHPSRSLHYQQSKKGKNALKN